MTVINPWREAIIDQLVCLHIYRREHDDNPRMALHDLLAWEVTIALDPLVSSGARELIQRGRAEAQQAELPQDLPQK